jgi:cytochrome c biogenesis protein CcdA
MKIGICLIILAALMISSAAHAHSIGDSVPAGMDIAITPEQAFQDDEIGIQATVMQNGVPVSGAPVFLIFTDSRGESVEIGAKEREPGVYYVKRTFRAAGENEVRVEFSYGGRIVTKNFHVDVAGRDAGIEQMFLLGGVVLVALCMIQGIMSRKYRRAILFSLAVIAIAGIAYSVYVVQTSGAAQRGVVVCLSETECYWSAHIHSEIHINVCGDTSYRFPIEVGRLDGPHTHEEKNWIHYHERLRIDPLTKEILNTSPLTLGAFFREMNVNFSETEILNVRNGDNCNGQAGSVKMYVSRNWNRNELGKPSALFDDYVWRDGDVVTIIFDTSPAPAVEREDQYVSAEQTPELSLPIIIGFALIDSINPCVIGVLLLLITVLVKQKKKKQILVKGGMYTLGVYITYLLGGLTLLSIFNAVREIQAISQLFYIVIGLFVLLAAFLEIKDYFWYGRWFSLAIPHRFVAAVEANAKKAHTGLVSAFLFGTLVTLVELPCTGAPYLAILTLMSQTGVEFYSALALLLLYNLVFVLPLLVIIYLAYRGMSYKRMEMWRKEQKGNMRLGIGLMLLGIAVWIITTVWDWALPYLVGGSIGLIIAMYIIKHIENYKLDKGVLLAGKKKRR